MTCTFLWVSRAEAGLTREKVGIILADDNGKIIYSLNPDSALVPASIIKILTSMAALDTLGHSYRFKTRYYLDKKTRNLYIKGYGDPLFISEAIEHFCQEIIREYTPGQIHHIILDDSFFESRLQIPGKSESLNPYDAPVGALCANFNTIFFKRAPDGTFVSGEPQTPLLDIFLDRVKKTGLARGRILLDENQSRLYPGLLTAHFLSRNGVPVSGGVRTGSFPDIAPQNSRLFKSPFDLTVAVQKLLRYSNNFIANQLMLAMSAETQSPPATLENAAQVLNTYGKSLLKDTSFTLVEGSGLSRQNRITPRQMLTLLQDFKPNHHLLRKGEQEWYKTGTLKGIRTRAGYIRHPDGSLYPFVIMKNNTQTGYDGTLEDLKKRTAEN